MMRIPCSRSSIGVLAMGRRRTMRDARAPPQMDDAGQSAEAECEETPPSAHSRESGNPRGNWVPATQSCNAAAGCRWRRRADLTRLLEIVKEMQVLGGNRRFD